MDELDAVDAQMLGHWLQAQTGNPRAGMVHDAPARSEEAFCAIEIRWRDPELNRLRFPCGDTTPVVSAFSHFLTVDS